MLQFQSYQVNKQNTNSKSAQTQAHQRSQAIAIQLNKVLTIIENDHTLTSEQRKYWNKEVIKELESWRDTHEYAHAKGQSISTTQELWDSINVSAKEKHYG